MKVHLLFLLLTIINYVSSVDVTLQVLADEIGVPTSVRSAVYPGNYSESIFTTEVYGVIHAIDDNGVRVFLNISDLVLDLTASGNYGLLGLEFHPHFYENGKFYLYYALEGTLGTAQEFADPDVCDLNTLNQPWNTSMVHHVMTLEEWKYEEGTSSLNRVVLRINWPSGYNQGSSNLKFVNDIGIGNQLLVAFANGLRNFDAPNLAQTDDFIHGKLVSIDISGSWSSSTPVSKFSELSSIASQKIKRRGKGLRNVIGLSTEEHDDQLIKYLAITGQQNVEIAATAFIKYRARDDDPETDNKINFGWRGWEGNYPTTLEIHPCSDPEITVRSIVYENDTKKLDPIRWRPAVTYFHDDPREDRISSVSVVGNAPYNGNIEELKRKLVFAELLDQNTGMGALGFSKINKNNLENAQDYEKINIDFTFTDPLNFFTTIGINNDASRLFVGALHGFPIDSRNVGTLYEVIDV